MLTVVGELDSDHAMSPWFLLVMFLYLLFAIELSLVLAVVAISDCGLSVLQACVYILLEDQFSWMNLSMENCDSGSAQV